MRPCGSKPSGSEVRPGAIPTVPGSRRPRGVSRNTTSEDAVQAHTWGPEGRPEHCGLPFGLSLSPRTFTVYVNAHWAPAERGMCASTST